MGKCQETLEIKKKGRVENEGLILLYIKICHNASEIKSLKYKEIPSGCKKQDKLFGNRYTYRNLIYYKVYR